MITPAVLQSLYGVRPARAAQWYAPIKGAMEFCQATSPKRAAAFLAQVGCESGRLGYRREIWGPTPQQKRYEPVTTLSGRLGNIHPGDGVRYMGRGLLQTTGRANYAMTTVMLRRFGITEAPDFEATPGLLEYDLWAALAAGLYWRVKNLNQFADSDDFITLTRRINGGLNGLADRQALYTRALILVN